SAGDRGLLQVLAVDLDAELAPGAGAASPGPVDSHRLADFEAGHSLADRMDPASVLVSESERRVPGQGAFLELVHQMDVGVAGAGSADRHDHLARSRLGLGEVDELGACLPRLESKCFHGFPFTRTTTPESAGAGHR